MLRFIMLFFRQSTFITVACVGISLIAIFAILKAREGSPVITESVLEERVEINEKAAIEEDARQEEIQKSKQERQQKPQQEERQNLVQDESTLDSASSITDAIASLASLGQKMRSTYPKSKTIKAQFAAILGDIPQVIAALCQVQQSQHVLNRSTELKDCLDTVVGGLQTMCDVLGHDLEHDSMDEERLYGYFEQLKGYRGTLGYVSTHLESPQQPVTSRPLTPPPETKVKTTATYDLKVSTEVPPETEEPPPAYSPPASTPAAPELKRTVSSDPSLIRQLHSAVLKIDMDRVRQLLKDNVDPNAPYGRLQRRPVHEAARRNLVDCLNVLIENGALVDIEDSKGDTALHLAAWEGRISVCEALLDSGADIDRCSGRDGSTALFCAVSGRHPDLVRVLLSHGADPNVASAELYPLHQASVTGQADVCKLLLDHNAIVNCMDQDGNTPLHYAATSGSTEIAKLLIDHGARLDMKQAAGLTPCHWAAHKGHKEVLKLLIEASADVNVRSETDVTPLHCAASAGHSSCVRLLLKSGADVNVVTEDWNGKKGTPAKLAKAAGHKQLASLIGHYERKK